MRMIPCVLDAERVLAGPQFPLPTIFALHQCRRLYGVRSKLDRARNGRSVATMSADFQSTLSHRSEHENDGKARDVAATRVSQVPSGDGTARTYPASPETVDSTRVYGPKK